MEIILSDNESLFRECGHKFIHQADLTVDGIVYDIYFCEKCISHVKKERSCPYNLEDFEK